MSDCYKDYYFGRFNMHKNTLFLLKLKYCKNRQVLGASPPDPLASGGWELCLASGG